MATQFPEVPLIADLKNFPVADNAQVTVMGGLAANDGLGGAYLWQPYNTDPDNDITFDTVSSNLQPTGRWVRVRGASEIKQLWGRWTLTQENIDDKRFYLSRRPATAWIYFHPDKGIPQRRGIDFQYSSQDNSLTWGGYGLEQTLIAGDTIEYAYMYT